MSTALSLVHCKDESFILSPKKHGPVCLKTVCKVHCVDCVELRPSHPKTNEKWLFAIVGTFVLIISLRNWGK